MGRRLRFACIQTRRERFRQPILHRWTPPEIISGRPENLSAAIGVQNLVLVETDDAILLCPRERAQDVGKIVKYLEQQKLARLL